MVGDFPPYRRVPSRPVLYSVVLIMNLLFNTEHPLIWWFKIDQFVTDSIAFFAWFLCLDSHYTKCYSLLVNGLLLTACAMPGNSSSKAARKTSSTLFARMNSISPLTLSGSSDKSFSFLLGSMTLLRPAL